jgi:hypothetical protein
MASLIFTVIISLIIIFITHRGFYHLKHYLTNEETEHVGVFQTKKYDELINELNNIKHTPFCLNDTSQVENDMESELSEYIKTVE